MIALVASMLIGGLREDVLASLPAVESEELQQIFADPWTLWYDESVIPRAMQFGANSDPTHVHDGYHRFNDIDRTTNANIEFPWRDGGGLHESRDTVTVKFYWHPSHKPVRYWRSVRSSIYYRQAAFDWSFPVDSVVGEVIGLRRNGRIYPFELRLLTREEDAWDARVWRQFNSTKQLADRVWELGYPELASKIGNLPASTGTLVDNQHPRPAVSLEYTLSWIPELPDSLVEVLLAEPLREVLEPQTMTAKKTQVLPAGYLGGIVGHGRDTCMNCHEHVAKHVNHFDRPGRDWYGYVRGSDRIFSFHPFDRSSIAGNGGDLPVRFSAQLTASGHIAPYGGEEGYTTLR